MLKHTPTDTLCNIPYTRKLLSNIIIEGVKELSIPDVLKILTNIMIVSSMPVKVIKIKFFKTYVFLIKMFLVFSFIIFTLDLHANCPCEILFK